MMSSVIPARLDFQCGHAALVSLPRVKGESSVQRNLRIAMEKSGAQSRACDFCAPRLEVVVPQFTAPAVEEIEPVDAIDVIDVVETVELDEPTPLPVVTLPDATPPVAVLPVATLPEATPLPVQPVVASTRRSSRTNGTSVSPRVRRQARPAPRPETVAPAPVSAAGPVVAAARPTADRVHRFQVQYSAETVVEAGDMREALRLAAALGATDVIAITRES